MLGAQPVLAREQWLLNCAYLMRCPRESNSIGVYCKEIWLVYDVGVRSKLFSTELEVVPPSVLRRVVIASTAVANVMLPPSDVVRPVGVEANCKQATFILLKVA